ncbi:hypothetical protein ACFFWC_01215 [Plantactinospora siamensis]|uniref:Methyl-accepting chemotaxis protein n=1 Tax=Plantactinospora siamensis TaxID=555372 RepID=A0ABV6NTC3_9ACTN
MALPLPGPAALVGFTRSAVNQAAGLPARAFGILDDIETLVRRINAVVDRAEGALERTEKVLDRAEVAVGDVEEISTAATAVVNRVTELTATAAALVGDVDRVAAGAAALVGDAERVTAAAAGVVGEAERVSAAAGAVVGEAELVTGRAAATVVRADAAASTAAELLAAYEETLRKGAPMAERFVRQLSPEEVTAAIELVDELPRLTRHVTADVLPILATLDRVGPDIHDLLEVTRDLRLAVAGIPGLKILRRRGEERLADEDRPDAAAPRQGVPGGR